ncbi:MAG: hypothetical protein J6P35_00415 [Aeriscardovia sp.]|nr:hypothetical protein [Aeriscardovia sp.]
MKRDARSSSKSPSLPQCPGDCFDLLLAACWRLSQLRYVFLIWAEKGNMNPNFEPVLRFCSRIISPWPKRDKCLPPSLEMLKKEKEMFASMERHVSSFRHAEREADAPLMADELVQVADFASAIRALCDPTFTPASFLDEKAAWAAEGEK